MGVYFLSRGIGTDTTPGCFVCGGETKPWGYSNIAAFVNSKEAGEQCVAMFGGKGAWLDYRGHEPSWIQVKVGACDAHLPNLKVLEREAIKNNNTLNEAIIEEARQVGIVA